MSPDPLGFVIVIVTIFILGMACGFWLRGLGDIDCPPHDHRSSNPMPTSSKPVAPAEAALRGMQIAHLAGRHDLAGQMRQLAFADAVAQGHPYKDLRQYSDQAWCACCGLTWDMNDACPPACDPLQDLMKI